MKETREFKLLLLLTHPQPDEQHDIVRQHLSDTEIDWPNFLKKVKWHNVTPQVYDNLKHHSEIVPEDILEKLHKHCMQCKKNALKQSAYLVKIARIFKEHQIKFISLKGVALSQILYNDIATRVSCDIDIVIDFNDIERAEIILMQESGFIRMIPDRSATKKQVSYLNKRFKDRVYFHPDSKISLELHYRFNDIQALFKVSFDKIYSASQTCYISNQSIPFLSGEHLWLYQSLHGSMANWSRISWICDIAKMFYKFPADYGSLLRLSSQYNCRRSLVEAVMLAAKLYDLPVPKEISEELLKDKKYQKEVEHATFFLLDNRIPSLVARFFRHLYFAPASSFFVYYSRKILLCPDDFTRYPMRDGWFFLYYSLRPVFRIIRIFK